MAKWGYNKWGLAFPWGLSSGAEVQEFIDLAKSRLLYQHCDGPNLNILAEIIGRRWGQIYAVLKDMLDGFDLETAQGEQLDIIGAIVGLSRQGFQDASYRSLLKMQIQLILPSTGTAENIITIVRTYVDELGDGGAVTFSEYYPAKFTVSGVLTSDDLDILLPFVKAAKPAAVGFHIAADPENVLLVDDVVTPVSTPLEVDDVTSPLGSPPAGLLTTLYS